MQIWSFFVMPFLTVYVVQLRAPELADYEGKDVLLSLPTGFGKSIYFHDPPLCV